MAIPIPRSSRQGDERDEDPGDRGSDQRDQVEQCDEQCEEQCVRHPEGEQPHIRTDTGDNRGEQVP